MKRVRWKWFLPVAQLALALACHVYGPHEYRVGLRRSRAVNDPAYYGQNYPALAERISQGINFPALAVDYPFRDNYYPIFQRNSEYGYISIYPRDIGFFFSIVLFWQWVGREIDKSQGRTPESTWPRKARMAGLACGIVFGILTGIYAGQMIAIQLLPERQIGAFGIVWACALIVYFTWRLTREFSLGTSSKSI